MVCGDGGCALREGVARASVVAPDTITFFSTAPLVLARSNVNPLFYSNVDERQHQESINRGGELISGPYAQAISFTDFDLFAESAAEWDLRFRQLGRGIFRGDLLQADCEATHLDYAEFGAQLEQMGAPPGLGWTFAFLARSSASHVWRRRTSTPENLMVFPPGSELDSITDAGFKVFTFAVSEEHLSRVAADSALPEIRRLLAGRDLLRVPAPALQRLRRTAGAIVRELKVRPQSIRHAGLQEQMRSALPAELLRAIARAQGIGPTASRRLRDRSMARAEDFISENARHPLTVSDLCQAAGASAPTLRRAFRERYGVSPKAYLTARRLNGLRRDLRAPELAHFGINDLAIQWGFWHMGQLAADYRRHFGELPSVTRRCSIEA